MQKLTSKINELHTCIEKTKIERAEESEKKAIALEVAFQESHERVEGAVSNLASKVNLKYS